MSKETMRILEERRVCGRAKPAVKRMSTWLLAWSVLGFGTGTFASGCGVSADEICNIKCNCQGCSQAERDDCVSDVNATVDKAEELGCSAQYADWLSCVEQEAECHNGDTFAWDGCDIEEDALAECGGGNSCSAAAKKLCDECAFSCSDPDPSTCSGRIECLSTCIVNATCEEVATSSGTYASCVAACP